MSRHIERLEQKDGKSVRVFPSIVAGQFYPGSREILARAIRGYLDEVHMEPLAGARALVSPHAGYVYSAKVAATGYKSLVHGAYDKVIIIGSNHNSRAPYFKVSVAGSDYFETPFGRLAVMPLASRLISKGGIFSYVLEAHMTHIIEVQLPFLQSVIGDVAVLPMVTGDLTPGELKEIADTLLAEWDDRTLLVVSSDLSHYHNYEEATRLDRMCIDTIVKQDLQGLTQVEACGNDALVILAHISRARGWRAKVLDYRNSGDTSGDRSRVVGYGSVVFFEPGVTP